jgi:hypothetical protein
MRGFAAESRGWPLLNQNSHEAEGSVSRYCERVALARRKKSWRRCSSQEGNESLQDFCGKLENLFIINPILPDLKQANVNLTRHYGSVMRAKFYKHHLFTILERCALSISDLNI